MTTDKKLIPNGTITPNVLYDFVFPYLFEGELKCLLYICRRTYGFHKERDRISLSQFVCGIRSHDGNKLDGGAGISRPTAIEALKILSESGLVNKIKTPKGDMYGINLDCGIDSDKSNKIIQKIRWLRDLTRTGKAALPRQVKLFNPQKKGKLVNKI